MITMVKERMDFCIGIDSETTSEVTENVEIKQCLIRKKLPVESELANVVTMLAVLEHLDYPRAIVHELFRILKPGGTLLLTVPSPRNKFLLEILAPFGVVRREMIAQHKYYFTPAELKELFTEVGFRNVEVQLFQLGLNTFVRATK
jgi:ubiquinone/menaquinone biosynthesis C-methylase UbiE